MELPDQPETLEQILVDCRDTLKYGVRTGLCVLMYLFVCMYVCLCVCVMGEQFDGNVLETVEKI